MRASTIALWTSALIGIALAVGYHGHLPETVATHFGSGGRANGWMSRDAQTLFMIGLFLLMSGFMAAMGLIVKRVNPRFVNLPRKDYWFATPERREEIGRRMSIWGEVFGVAMNGFFIGLQHLVYLANQRNPPLLDETMLWVLLAVFLSFTLGSTLYLTRRLVRPPEGERT